MLKTKRPFPISSISFGCLLCCCASLGAQTLRFNTTLGGIDVILTPATTPITVANFMSYVNSGEYNNTIIHRSLNVANSTEAYGTATLPYVVQGGGYAMEGILPVLIPQSAPITNEFSASNTAGTLAMALEGSNTDSAQSEWFFNTVDNSSVLDSQDFTVFGNIGSPASLAVATNINNQATFTYDAGQEADLTDLPLINNYVAGELPKAGNFIYVTSIVPVTPADSAAGVEDAASAQSNNTIGISPGEMLTLYGSFLGPQQVTTLTLDPTGTFVTSALETTQVLFNGTPGPMIFTSSGQIAVVVPYEIAGQSTVSVVVQYLGIQTNPITFNVVPATPALFTLAQNGSGDAAIVRVSDGSVISASNPASVGDTLELYGEGYGVTSPQLADGTVVGSNLPQPAAKTTVLIDGKTVVTPLYAGGAYGDVNGVMQVNFVVPQLAAGSHTLQLQVGSALSAAGVTLETQ